MKANNDILIEVSSFSLFHVNLNDIGDRIRNQ